MGLVGRPLTKAPRACEPRVNTTSVEEAGVADQRYPVRRPRGLLRPVLGGLLLIAAVVAGIAFRRELWRLARWAGGTVTGWLSGWVPAHPRQTQAIIGFAIVALVINWIAHVRGRLRAWIFALVVESGLWLLFWTGPGIPSLNDLSGLKIEKMGPGAIALSGILVIAITGVVFWLLEAREEWLAYRRQHHVDDD